MTLFRFDAGVRSAGRGYVVKWGLRRETSSPGCLGGAQEEEQNERPPTVLRTRISLTQSRYLEVIITGLIRQTGCGCDVVVSGWTRTSTKRRILARTICDIPKSNDQDIPDTSDQTEPPQQSNLVVY